MEVILLRPLWLLALLPWLWQGWQRSRSRPMLAPAMQAYLLPHAQPTRPWLWLASLPVIVALSGPAISTATVTSRSPALDIWLLDLSGSMAAHDLAPDRATRVRVQLQQWLATPADHRIALILYAADAYLAMPATADHRALALLLPDLRPSIMPSPRLSSARFGQQGQPPSGSSDAPERAIALALAQIPEGEQARLLLITDDLDGVQRAKIEAQLAAASPCQWRLFCPQPARVRLDILLANSGKAATMPPHPASDNSVNRLARLPIPNSEEMTTLAQRFGGQLQWLSTTPPRFAPLPTTSRLATAHVQELGPWLLIPLLALALRARAGHLWLLLLALTGGALHSPATQASAAQQITQATVDVSQEAHAMAAYQRGAFRWAAQHFSQPIWQGNAWYRAGDYRQAVVAYQQDQSATAHYNRGNALVQLGELAAAEDAYLAALAQQPDHHDARYNLSLLQQRATAQPHQRDDPTPPPPAAAHHEPDPQPPAPPILLLEQRLRKEAERRAQPPANQP